MALGTPFGWMVYGVVTGGIGPDPADRVMILTGEWGMYALLLALSATPLRKRGWTFLASNRRMLGLYAFFYCTLHALTFGQVFIAWDGEILLEELAERPYVVVGFTAWLLLVPLALTSTRRWRIRIGIRAWGRLHQLSYLVAVLGITHIWWLARADLRYPIMLALVATVLLSSRVFDTLSAKKQKNCLRVS